MQATIFMPELEKMPALRIYRMIQFGYRQEASVTIKSRSLFYANFCQLFLQIWVKPGRFRVDSKRIIVDFKKEGVLKIAHQRL
jgi:hypothetical protein